MSAIETIEIEITKCSLTGPVTDGVPSVHHVGDRVQWAAAEVPGLVAAGYARVVESTAAAEVTPAA